jgi:hypothetical protein
MIERIGTWNPSEWPEVGDEKVLPSAEALTLVTIVTEVVPGSHIVVEAAGRRWKGFPRVVKIRNASVDVWDFEDA